MARIIPAQHVTRVFNQRMLEPAAGAQEGNAVFTRIARGNKGRLRVFIRACRHQPDGIVANQIFGTGQLGRRNPVVVRRELQNSGSVVNSQRDGLVRNNLGIVIADQRNAQRRFNRKMFHGGIPYACGVFNNIRNLRLPIFCSSHNTLNWVGIPEVL
ncbi:Uncharacterised protein [Enterobacter cancerogenus]|uniref:Uncharacterized protein n=1 Tax=Enterobacter cancerogenus TaxID=69218 RepID=A0A484XNW1_9ENTR|nr:Uncharacterised protein [Enterobacter cancerogenus]